MPTKQTNILSITPAQAEKARKNVMLPACILSHPHVFVPRPKMDNEDKLVYSCQLMWKKDELEDADMRVIRRGIMAGIVAGIGNDKSKWPSPSKRHNPFMDGDVEKFSEDPDKYPEYENTWYMNAKNTEDYQPEVLKLVNGKPVDASPKDIYGGCIVVPIVDFYWFAAKNPKGVIVNRGITCALISILKIQDGEPLGKGGPRNAAQMYSAIDLGNGLEEEDLSEQSEEELISDDYFDEDEPEPVKKKVTKKVAKKKVSKKKPVAKAPAVQNEEDFLDAEEGEEEETEEDEFSGDFATEEDDESWFPDEEI